MWTNAATILVREGKRNADTQHPERTDLDVDEQLRDLVARMSSSDATLLQGSFRNDDEFDPTLFQGSFRNDDGAGEPGFNQIFYWLRTVLIGRRCMLEILDNLNP